MKPTEVQTIANETTQYFNARLTVNKLERALALHTLQRLNA